MKKVGIYRLNWPESGYFYIGQSIDINHRFARHKEGLIRNCHKNAKVQNVYNKYGMPLFEIIEECTYDKLNEREQFYIDSFFGQKECCNLNPNAISTKGYKYSQETIERVKLLRKHMYKKGAENPNFGRKATLEARIKMSDAQKGSKSHMSKIILDTNTGVFYYCIKELTDLYNFNHRNMCRYLSGSRKNKTQFIYA
jgi:group I intron endonuclease